MTFGQVMLDILRFVALVEVAIVYGAILAVGRHYARMEHRLPWWAHLLPGHVWRVALGSAIVSAGSAGVTIEHLGDSNFVWYGSPIAIFGNSFLIWGLWKMLRYLRMKAEHGTRTGDRRRLGTTSANEGTGRDSRASDRP